VIRSFRRRPQRRARLRDRPQLLREAVVRPTKCSTRVGSPLSWYIVRGILLVGRRRAGTEVRDWYLSLRPQDAAFADHHIELLAERGVLLGEPYTRHLDGKLRELRFHIGHASQRITYYIATGRRIILLTVFQKTRQQERREIARAKRAMETCIADGHTAEE